jgi:hypothetical protein
MNYDDMNGWVLGDVLSYHFNLIIWLLIIMSICLLFYVDKLTTLDPTLHSLACSKLIKRCVVVIIPHQHKTLMLTPLS